MVLKLCCVASRGGAGSNRNASRDLVHYCVLGAQDRAWHPVGAQNYYLGEWMAWFWICPHPCFSWNRPTRQWASMYCFILTAMVPYKCTLKPPMCRISGEKTWGGEIKNRFGICIPRPGCTQTAERLLCFHIRVYSSRCSRRIYVFVWTLKNGGIMCHKDRQMIFQGPRMQSWLAFSR